MSEQKFDPSRYLVSINGRGEYLEVRWRLVWLRAEHPDASIYTEAVDLGPDYSIFKATISVPNGGAATGYGSETASDFRDHLEKAETKAIGRALAALGYGTQFCPDHDFGAHDGRVVDTPMNRPRGGKPVVGQLATERQLKFIRALADEMRADVGDIDHLTRQQAAAIIEDLQQRRLDAQPTAPTGAGAAARPPGRTTPAAPPPSSPPTLPSSQQPAAAPTAAGPLAPDPAAIVERAWALFEEGKGYAEIVTYLRPFKAALSEQDQAAVNAEARRIKAQCEERDRALQPAGYAG
ncbi:MAG TPA: hypothetical protein VF041_23230 [Gemmatimonadaceae bacterium]